MGWRWETREKVIKVFRLKENRSTAIKIGGWFGQVHDGRTFTSFTSMTMEKRKPGTPA